MLIPNFLYLAEVIALHEKQVDQYDLTLQVAQSEISKEALAELLAGAIGPQTTK